MESSQNLCERVRQSAELVMKHACHVSIDQKKITEFAESLESLNFTSWSECHFDHRDISLQDLLSFIFVVDSLNFCFWPTPGFEYDNLTQNLKKQLDLFPEFFSAEYLAHSLTLQSLKERIFESRDFSLLEERTSFLKNLGSVLISSFEGKYQNFLKAANNSAVKLVSLIYNHLEGFKDSFIITKQSGYPSQLHQHQVFFLKRAQILTADIYAALSERNDCLLFPDIDELTMFPDYRVPQILSALGVLNYSPELRYKIDLREEISSESEMETEIRASTIVAVEKIKEEFKKRNKKFNSIQVDWYLWERGEKLKDEIPPHHRTLTKFY